MHLTSSLNSWSEPPLGFYKMNFDGDYKGNLKKVGYGGFFRSPINVILRLFYGSLAIESNNSAELTGLLQGIRLTFNHDLFPLIVEGDSHLILNMATRIQNGSNITKIPPQLEAGL